MSNKVFRICDEEWWATSGTKEELVNFLLNRKEHDYDKDILYPIDKIYEVDKNTKGAWTEKILTQEQVDKLDNNYQYTQIAGKVTIGDIKDNYVYTSFAEEMGEEPIKQPYLIATIL